MGNTVKQNFIAFFLFSSFLLPQSLQAQNLEAKVNGKLDTLVTLSQELKQHPSVLTEFSKKYVEKYLSPAATGAAAGFSATEVVGIFLTVGLIGEKVAPKKGNDVQQMAGFFIVPALIAQVYTLPTALGVGAATGALGYGYGKLRQVKDILLAPRTIKRFKKHMQEVKVNNDLRIIADIHSTTKEIIDLLVKEDGTVDFDSFLVILNVISDRLHVFQKDHGIVPNEAHLSKNFIDLEKLSVFKFDENSDKDFLKADFRFLVADIYGTIIYCCKRNPSLKKAIKPEDFTRLDNDDAKFEWLIEKYLVVKTMVN